MSVVEQLTEVNGTLAVGPPKTAAARRSVSVPPTLADLMQEQLERRSVNGLMFPSAGGDALRRSNFRRRAWTPATRQVGLDELRFHDLRHTAVALAIAQGAHPKASQERMGHSSITVTLDRYGHLFPGIDERIADGLDDVLRGALAVTPRSGRGHEVVELSG